MRATRTQSLTATVTCIAFTALVVWPTRARAEGPPPPSTPPPTTAAPATGAPATGAPATGAPANNDTTMQQAKQHFETGRNAYNAGDYVTAIREFKAAEALRPSPILDYNIGLANEKLGKRRVAVKYYHRYLDEQPNASNKAEVEQKIQTLEAEIATQPPAAATATPGGTAPQPGGATSPPTAEQPSDMPPPDARASQPGYDPYASQSPPGQPVAAKPAKKRSLWWIWLIVGGAVTLTIVIAVAVYFSYSTTTTVYPYNHALDFSPAPRVDSGPRNLTLFRF